MNSNVGTAGPVSFLSGFVKSSSDVLESPLEYLPWAALSALSCAVGRAAFTFIRNSKSNRDRLYPNMMVLLLGPPGQGKTSAIFEARYLCELAGVQFFPDSLTPASFAQINQNRGGSIAFMPSNIAMLWPPNSYISQSLKNSFMEGYDCNPYSRATASMGVESFKDICVNLLSASTPAKLSQIFSPTDWEDGLTSRFIFVSGSVSRLDSAGTRDEDLADSLVKRLKDLRRSPLGEIPFTKEGLARLRSWRIASQKDQIPHPNLITYWSRRYVSVAKIALLHAIDSDESEITLEHVNKAIQLLTATEKHLTQAFAASGANPYRKAQLGVHKWLSTQKTTVHERDIRRRLGLSVPSDKLDRVLEDMIESGFLDPKGGDAKPNRVFMAAKKESLPDIY